MELLKSVADNYLVSELFRDPEEAELALIRILASSYNRLDSEVVKPFLDVDVVYESQISLTPVRGKAEVILHLDDKFANARRDSITRDVYAEIGYCGGPTVPVYLFGTEGKPCVLLERSYGGEPIGLIIIEVHEVAIRRIDVCIVAPNPLYAARTGEYPE